MRAEGMWKGSNTKARIRNVRTSVTAGTTTKPCQREYHLRSATECVDFAMVYAWTAHAMYTTHAIQGASSIGKVESKPNAAASSVSAAPYEATNQATANQGRCTYRSATGPKTRPSTTAIHGVGRHSLTVFAIEGVLMAPTHA